MSLFLIVEFKDDPDLYVFPKLKYVGIELWQVTSLFLALAMCNYLLFFSYGSYLKFVLILYMFQVKSGTLFDNVLICDDPEYAKQLAEETWGKQKDVCYFINILYISFY